MNPLKDKFLLDDRIYKLLFFLFIIISLTPMALTRDYTPANELRYLSIAAEGIRNNDIFTFSNHGIDYADKPPLYLWIMMLGYRLFGNNAMFFLTFFSIIPAFVIIAVMDKWVSPCLDTETKRTGMWMTISSVLFLGLAVVLRMDLLMNMFITLSLYCFFNMYRAYKTGTTVRKRDVWLFPLYVFSALFSKGPLGFLIPFVCTMVFLIIKKDFRSTGKFWGWRTWLVLSAGCLLWFSGVYLEGGTEYLNNLLFHQTLDRAVNAFHHKEPFYFYFITFWYSLAPWSILVAAVVIAAIIKKQFKNDMELFFGLTTASIFIMLSCFSSKLSIYLSPAIPFFIYLTLLLMQHDFNKKLIVYTTAPVIFIFAIAVIAFIIMAQKAEFSYLNEPVFYMAAILLSTGNIFALYYLLKKKFVFKAFRITVMSVFLAVFIAGFGIPKINPMLGYKAVCDAALEMADNRGNNTALQKETESSSLSDRMFLTYKVSRPENMDVFLGKEIINANKNIEEVMAGKYDGSILIINRHNISMEKHLLQYIKDKPTRECGKFIVVAL